MREDWMRTGNRKIRVHWSKKELSELADAVEAGERKVFFDPDYHPEG